MRQQALLWSWRLKADKVNKGTGISKSTNMTGKKNESKILIRLKQKFQEFAAFKTRCIQICSGYQCSRTNPVIIGQSRPSVGLRDQSYREINHILVAATFINSTGLKDLPQIFLLYFQIFDSTGQEPSRHNQRQKKVSFSFSSS